MGLALDPLDGISSGGSLSLARHCVKKDEALFRPFVQTRLQTLPSTPLLLCSPSFSFVLLFVFERRGEKWTNRFALIRCAEQIRHMHKRRKGSREKGGGKVESQAEDPAR